MSAYETDVPEVIYDRGRLGPKNTEAFNKFLNNTYTDYEYLGQRLYLDDTVRFRDEDSKKDSGLWGADLVAGSFRHLHVYNDPTYTDLLQPKFLETGSRIFFLVDKVAGVPTKPSDTSYLSYDTVLVDLHAYTPYMSTFYLCFYKTRNWDIYDG